MTNSALERRHAFVSLSHDQIATLISPAFGSNALVKAEPLTGGKINANYKLTLKDAPFHAVLRIFARGRKTCCLERDILKFIKGRVSAPLVIHDGSDGETPYLVLTWVPGLPLDQALKEGACAPELLGRNTGQTLAQIHSIGFPEAGFYGDHLTIEQTFTQDSGGFLSFVETALSRRASKRLGSDLTTRFQNFLSRRAQLLDALPRRACLVHSDFNPPNLKADEKTITGVLDWEFAHSGSPLTDIANMLRPRAYQTAAFNGTFIHAYEKEAGPLPQNWQSLSRMLDLMAQIEMLDAPEERPNIFDWARARITDTIHFVDEMADDA